MYRFVEASNSHLMPKYIRQVLFNDNTRQHMDGQTIEFGFRRARTPSRKMIHGVVNFLLTKKCRKEYINGWMIKGKLSMRE